MINSLCYPLIFPYGRVPFENSTIPLIKPTEVTQDTLDFLNEEDGSGEEDNLGNDSVSCCSEDVADDGEDVADEVVEDEELSDADEDDDHENQVLRPTDDDVLDEDPPTEDEPEDQPLLPASKRISNSNEPSVSQKHSFTYISFISLST